VLFQIVSVIGAILILYAYVALQVGRMQSESIWYQVLNLVGGAALLATALANWQWGFIILEGVWTGVSAAGLTRLLRSSVTQGTA